MAKDRCIDRLEKTLKQSSISSAKAEDIIQSIKDDQKEVRLDNLYNEFTDWEYINSIPKDKMTKLFENLLK